MEKMCRIPALVLHETAIALVGGGTHDTFGMATGTGD
jgi:hypothetical protein